MRLDGAEDVSSAVVAAFVTGFLSVIMSFCSEPEFVMCELKSSLSRKAAVEQKLS